MIVLLPEAIVFVGHFNWFLLQCIMERCKNDNIEGIREQDLCFLNCFVFVLVYTEIHTVKGQQFSFKLFMYKVMLKILN